MSVGPSVSVAPDLYDGSRHGVKRVCAPSRQTQISDGLNVVSAPFFFTVLLHTASSHPLADPMYLCLQPATVSCSPSAVLFVYSDLFSLSSDRYKAVWSAASVINAKLGCSSRPAANDYVTHGYDRRPVYVDS